MTHNEVNALLLYFPFLLSYLLSLRHLVTTEPNMERLGNKRLEAEITRIWDNIKASEAREVSALSTDSQAQQESTSSKGVPGRSEHDMAVTKKTISRRLGSKNAAKLWPYVTSFSMVREMRTVANTGISFEKVIQTLNRVVLDRLVKPHPGYLLTTALSKVDSVAASKDTEREEVTAEEAQQQGYVFEVMSFFYTATCCKHDHEK